MKGIILSGGTGSRLYPLTWVTNKHLLPVGKYPMIFHSIHKLKQAGMTDILIVTGKEHLGDVVSLLGSGARFGVELTYKVQDSAGGIAQALRLAKSFVGDELMTVLLGDNIFEAPLSGFADHFRRQGRGARLLVKAVADSHRYGVAELRFNRIVDIVEKPALSKSTYAVTGIYFYDRRVFDIIDGLFPSERNELEITDVNNAYLRSNELTYDILPGWWTDAGTHASLSLANEWSADLVLGEGFEKGSPFS